MLDEVRAFSVGLEELGLKRGDKFAIIGANRPRLYWAMCAGQALGAVPVPIYADSVADEMAYVLEHAEVTVAVVENQEQVDKVLSIQDRLTTLRHMVYDEPRGLRDYDRAKLSWIDDVQKVGREKLAGSGPARALGGLGRAGQGLRPRRDPLHLGHHRAAEGRHAELRQHDHLGAQRQPVRQARRERGDHRLSAARLGRRPPVLLRAALCGGLLRQLSGSRRDRGGGPARDRHHLCVRAAAHLREPAHPHDGAHGGCRRAEAQDVPLLHRPRAQVGREDPQQRAGAADRAADLPARRRPGLCAR